MIVDIHAHLYMKGWVPSKWFHGIARFITHEFAKQGINQSNEEVGDSLLDACSDPDAVGLLEEMDNAGIDMSLIFPLDFGLSLGEPEVPIEEVNKKYAALARRHPDRLIAFAGVDPRRAGALELFVRCIEEWGMKGLKLHPCAGFYPNQEEVYPLLEKAQKWKIPVITHTGRMMQPFRSKYAESIYLDDVAVDFPDLPIIAAHAGGIFGYPQLVSIMVVKLNILADISGWQLYAAKDYPAFCKALRQIIDHTEAGRVFFGSDTPSGRSMMSNPDWVQVVKDLPKNAPDGIDFTEEEISAILGGNARKLLNL
jgi:hypothetical protein